jgi:hypothetical protein
LCARLIGWPSSAAAKHKGENMPKKCLAALVMVGLICSVAFAADEFDWTKESMGKLRPDLSEKDVKQIIPGKPSRGPEQLWGADGEYHQEWKYPDGGITLGMVSKKKGGPKSIWSITIISPSTLQTSKGIHIGSTEPEVEEAYGRFRNAEDSKKGEVLVAGSIFGGLIFNFQQGKVSRIFIGAAAE